MQSWKNRSVSAADVASGWSNYLDEFRAAFVAIDRFRDKVKNIYLHVEMHYGRLGYVAPWLLVSLFFVWSFHSCTKVNVNGSEICEWKADCWLRFDYTVELYLPEPEFNIIGIVFSKRLSKIITRINLSWSNILFAW